MKTIIRLIFFGSLIAFTQMIAARAGTIITTNPSPAIPWSQLGVRHGGTGADYHGDGLAVVPTAEGARLRCVFQRLEGEATREGLWLTSTLTNGTTDRFRVTAAAVGRQSCKAAEGAAESGGHWHMPFNPSAPAYSTNGVLHPKMRVCCGEGRDTSISNCALASSGNLSIVGQTVRFTRRGLVEEYSVSMDGVRQDFILPERPVGTGEMAVQLAVTGARVEQAATGATLALKRSGRKIAYSGLRVTDATGKELTARMEVSEGRDASHRVPVVPGEDQGRGGACPYLLVLINDTDAVYPLRIDPTFSDANWISMNSGIAGANSWVYAAVVDGSGNLYIGGTFTLVGDDVLANRIAKWNGASWTALGSGMNGHVFALAVSGSDLYAGGEFTTAGGIAANSIAKWNGSSWSALGSGIGGPVYALAVSGSSLYAGGYFTTAGGKLSPYVARAIVNPPVLAIQGDGDGGYFIRFSGVPGSAYRLQRAPSLTGPWATSSPQTAPGSGLLEFWDLFPPPGQGFYRSMQP